MPDRFMDFAIDNKNTIYLHLKHLKYTLVYVCIFMAIGQFSFF